MSMPDILQWPIIPAASQRPAHVQGIEHAVTAIRSPAVAGTFYPADPDVLRRQIAGFLAEADNAPPAGAAPPKAIIGPHAGYVYSGAVAARAYARLAAARGQDQPRRADRAVALRRLPGPRGGHRAGLGDARRHRARSTPRRSPRCAGCRMVGELEAAYAREHALEVHVPFLQQVLGDFRLVPIVAGDAPPEAVAARVRRAVGRAGDADRGVHRPVALPRLRRLPAHGQPTPPRRSSASTSTPSARPAPAARCRRAACCWRRAGAA